MDSSELEKKAGEILSRNAFDFYRSGAGDELTLKLNREAFRRLRIIPRLLHGVLLPKIKCTLSNFKDEFECPLGIAPMGMQGMAHPEGEAATAKAAGEAGCIFILSTVSTTSIEKIAAEAPNTHKWFQLYIYKDRSLTENLIRRAETSGFKALVLTVDTPRLGIRRADIRNNFRLPPNLKLANFRGIQAEGVTSEEGDSGVSEYVSKQFDPSLSWRDVEWLVNFTTLPVVLKGILTPEDAILALQFGCKGIIVSNHGARQLDGVPASIEVLPRISKAVGDKLIVMMDGGVSQGNDVFKAIALGAKIVFIGRPALWGLAVNGQKGVESVLETIKSEFMNTMIRAGCSNLSEIKPSMVVHSSHFSNLREQTKLCSPLNSSHLLTNLLDKRET